MANRKRNIQMKFYVTGEERRIGMKPAREVLGGKYGLSHLENKPRRFPPLLCGKRSKQFLADLPAGFGQIKYG